MVRKAHENSAHRRVSSSQPSPTRPVTRAAMAKANGHREADVPEVQDRRVEQDQDVVLQQRVGAGPVEPGGDRWAVGERVGRAEAQQGEERQHDEHHGEGPADEWVPGAAPEAPADGSGEAGQDDDPQQDRPLEGRPHRGHVVERRRGAGADLLDVGQREVAGDQRPLHHDHGQHGAAEAQVGVDRRHAQDAPLAPPHAVDRGQRAERGAGQGQHQPGPPERAVQAGGEHVVASAGASSRRSAFSASYSLECLTSTRSPSNVPATSSPCTTTGWHSSKIPPGWPS